MNKVLYVGNLSPRTSETTLVKLFAGIGQVVSVNLVTNCVTDRLRGFALVKMAKKRAARKAIVELDGKIVDGQPIQVVEEHLRPTRGQGIPFGMRRHKRPPWRR